jgi:hypothetical protein
VVDHLLIAESRKLRRRSALLLCWRMANGENGPGPR